MGLPDKLCHIMTACIIIGTTLLFTGANFMLSVYYSVERTIEPIPRPVPSLLKVFMSHNQCGAKL
jgi:hypothetical protein